MKHLTRIIILLLAFGSFAYFLNISGCSDPTSSSEGSISVENSTGDSHNALIDGALVAALAPHEKKVLSGYAPGKYLVEIQPCSGAYVTVIAGETHGLVCYGK